MKISVQGRVLAAFVGILWLGFALRVIHLGDLSLWIDEGFSYFAVKQPDLLATLARDVHPPLYFVLLRAWAALTGVSEFALRYLSVLFSVVSIAMVYRLAREVRHLRSLPAESTFAVLAALFLAVAEMDTYVSQEVRSYSMHILLAVTSMWAFLRWIRLQDGRWAALWVLCTAALVYTHYLGAWVGVVQGLYVLVFLRGRRRVVAVGLLITAAAIFGMWLFGFVLPYQFNKADSDATMHTSNLETLVSYFYVWMGDQWALMAGLLALGVVGVVQNRILWRPSKASVLLLLWIIIPVGLTFLGNLRWSILTDYRLSQITVPVVILWALGLLFFERRVRLFLVAVIVIYGVVAVGVYRPKFPWRDFGGVAVAYFEPQSVALMDFKGVDFSMEYYLDRFAPPETQVFSLRQMVEWWPERIYTDFASAIAGGQGVWVPRWTDSRSVYDLMQQFGYQRTGRITYPYGTDTLEVLRFDPDASFEGEALAEFENGMTLEKAAVYEEDGLVHLWWNAENAPLDREYTTSLIVLGQDGRLIAQRDSIPLTPTSTWKPRQIVFDPKRLELADGVEALSQDADLIYAVQVYHLLPDGTVERVYTVDGQEYAVITP